MVAPAIDPSVFGNNDQVIVDTVAGPCFIITVTPNLADTAADYQLPTPPLTAPVSQRLRIPGRHNQESLRLEKNVIAEIESRIVECLQSGNCVQTTVNVTTTPRWDNQIHTIYFNAARARISTHEFKCFCPTPGNQTYQVSLLP